MRILSTLRRGALAAVAAGLAVPAGATTLDITVTNVAPAGGFSITPLYGAFHDGTFDAFSVNAPASAGVELIAEDGLVGGLPAERLAQSPGSQAVTIGQPANGVPTIDPGETASVRVNVDGAENPFFTFLSMLVPTNDTFLGNDDPLAIALFDALGGFTGNRTLAITGADLFDAGTEVNDPLGTPAFVLDPNALFTPSVDENGTVQPATSQAAFAGVATPVGILDGALIDFAGDPAAFDVATIEIALVPLPPGALLGLAGLGALGLVRIARRA